MRFKAPVAGAVLICLCFAANLRAEWTWDADAGWINMGEQPPSSDQGLYGYAAGLFTRGDYAAASEYFEKVIVGFSESPFAAKAQFGLARCEARLGRPANAVRLCNELLLRKPAGVNLEDVVSFQLAQLETLSGKDLARAGELVETVAQGAPTPALLYDALLRRARILLAQNRFDDAREAALVAAGKAVSDQSRDDALVLAAMCDMTACQAAQPSIMRMDRAVALLRPVAASGRNDDASAATAREYLPLAENALADPDVRRMRVYVAPVLLYQGRMVEARKFFSRARKQFKNTLPGETASYYYAETLFRERNYWSAFKSFQLFLEAYPSSARLRQAVEREFEIGQALGERGERSRSITVMQAVAANEPSGPLADDALMFAGRAQLDWGHPDDAKGTFDAILKSYPRSEWATTALYFEGVADLQNSALAGDRIEVLAEARAAFEVYLRNAPDGPFAADARDKLADTKEKQAAALVDVARFYERRDEPGAARVYYAIVAESLRDTSAASQARARLDALKTEGEMEP